MHGFEKEGIRIGRDGALSQALHPEGLGSSLTHPFITTDFTEAQLELRTAPSDGLHLSLDRLGQIHIYVAKTLDDELLWPFSMPPRLPDKEDLIPLAVYGTSSLGEKKTIYRRGIGLRYGRRRLTLSGVHYNFSMDPSETRRCALIDLPGNDVPGALSDSYFHIIRNLRRRLLYFTYLFGASPAFDTSYQAPGATRFKSHKSCTLYGEFATSLRSSEIGYASEVQDRLSISYDSVGAYVNDLAFATNTCNPDYLAFSALESNQLNPNYLQNAQELYAPFRPKQELKPGENPLDALRQRGLGYIELRLPDIDPECPAGIDPFAMGFVHMAILDCLMHPSPPLTGEESEALDNAHQAIIWRGREKGLKVVVEDGPRPFHDLGKRYCEGMHPLAERMDHQYGSDFYRESLRRQIEKWDSPELTPSGKLLANLLDNNMEFIECGVDIANRNADHFTVCEPDLEFQEEIESQTIRSREVQRELETEACRATNNAG